MFHAIVLYRPGNVQEENNNVIYTQSFLLKFYKAKQ